MGDVFAIQEGFLSYEKPNWAEALIIEFPEAVKKALPEGRRELFFYLPPESRNLVAYFSPFKDGLTWRAGSSIDESAHRLVERYLRYEDETFFGEMLEALVTVSTKPKHPYSGKRLFRYFSEFTMAKRDLTWTEWIRTSWHDGAVARVVAFYEEFPLDGMSAEAANQAVALLALCLTTTDRSLRDRLTHALVRLGLAVPQSLFQFAESALSFNDPYVGERVLAAMFGVAMKLPDCEESRRFLSSWAGWIAREMFSPGGRFGTSHVLMQDYALGIIDVAEFLSPGAINETTATYLRRPFAGVRNIFPDPKNISHRTIAKADRAIHQDFGNYTIGRLSPGRRNYDDKHTQHKRITRQIKWRMVSLGFDAGRFYDVDRSIGRFGSGRRIEDGDKVDRYGKKYSWIAYFEMYGLLHARLALDSDRRTPDCDIDPSFPRLERRLVPAYGRVLTGREARTARGWLRGNVRPDYADLHIENEVGNEAGPWIAMGGHIDEVSVTTAREVTVMFNAVFVDNADAEKFSERSRRKKYPDRVLMNRGSYTYLFAGEIGLQRKFGDAAGLTERIEPRDDVAFGKFASRKAKRDVRLAWYGVDLLLLRRYFRARTPSARTRHRRALARMIESINRTLPEAERIELREALDLRYVLGLSRGFELMEDTVMTSSIRVNMPVLYFEWESYHSRSNTAKFLTLSNEFCIGLKLRWASRSCDMLDSSGRLATMFVSDERVGGSGAAVLYIRKDLLDGYLLASNQTLFWVAQGERRLHSDAIEVTQQLYEDDEVKQGDSDYSVVRRYAS